MSDTHSIIKALGGAHAVARSLGANYDAVRSWYRIGVPYRHWPAIRTLAEKQGVDGITDAVLAAAKMHRPQVPA